MSLLYFVLASYGLTQILVFSRVLDKIRPPAHFFRCPMCVGFWVGAFLLLLNPFTELFTFSVTVLNAFLFGCIASGTSYALCRLISDGGFQIEHRDGRIVDSKVDAKASRKVLQG